VAPMIRTPSRAEVRLFIEHLRFYGHMLRGVSATLGASSLHQSLHRTSLGGSEQCCITSFRQPGYRPKWGPVALRPRLAARLPFRGAIPRNLPSSVKCTEAGRKIQPGPGSKRLILLTAPDQSASPAGLLMMDPLEVRPRRAWALSSKRVLRDGANTPERCP
jgi:hypothetical protein